jgi:hypothetical protein
MFVIDESVKRRIVFWWRTRRVHSRWKKSEENLLFYQQVWWEVFPGKERRNFFPEDLLLLFNFHFSRKMSGKSILIYILTFCNYKHKAEILLSWQKERENEKIILASQNADKNNKYLLCIIQAAQPIPLEFREKL